MEEELQVWMIQGCVHHLHLVWHQRQRLQDVVVLRCESFFEAKYLKMRCLLANWHAIYTLSLHWVVL